MSQLKNINSFNKFLLASVMAILLAFSLSNIAVAQDKAKAAELTLITATPEEGFALAVKLSQKGVSSVQKDADVRKKLRPDYANDADDLIAVSQVVAINFQTVAAANNYWRK